MKRTLNELKKHILNKDLVGFKSTVVQNYSKIPKMLYSKTPIPTTIPIRMCIELTNRCNLNCPFCLVGQQNSKEFTAHDELDRDMGGMNIDLCKKIIIDAKKFGIKEINLTFQGEPLMYKRKWFVELVKICKQEGLKSIVYTNGLLLEPDYSRLIIKAGMEELRFSVDGITQEVYELNRVGGKFETVFQNMKDMVNIAKEENSNIKLIWQFIALKNNEKQIGKANSMADEIGINFEVKTFAESVPESASEDIKYRRKLKLLPCTDIYDQVMVYWNGDVVACCYDLEGDEIMGNLGKNTIEKIWNGEKYKNFRKRLKDSVFSPELQPKFCKGCLKYSPPQEIQGNLASKAKTLLLYPFLK